MDETPVQDIECTHCKKFWTCSGKEKEGKACVSFEEKRKKQPPK